jgi:hypothetical protein
MNEKKRVSDHEIEEWEIEIGKKNSSSAHRRWKERERISHRACTFMRKVSTKLRKWIFYLMTSIDGLSHTNCIFNKFLFPSSSSLSSSSSPPPCAAIK